MHTAGSADTHDVQRAVFGLHLACLEVDVCQSVELGDYDINVVGANTMTQCHDGLTLVGSAYGVELARGDFKVLCVEIRSNHVDTGRITTDDDIIGQLLGLQMDVKY